MGTIPTTTNTLASSINSILKNLIEGAGVDVAMSLIIADVPWLGLPVIKQILEFILGKLAGYLYMGAADLSTNLVINIQIDVETNNVKNALADLQSAIDLGDQTKIDQASKNADAMFASLIHYNGSASP